MNQDLFQNAYHQAIEKTLRNCKKIGASYPHVAIGTDGSYNCEKPSFWTGGFWGGLLWLAYRAVKDPKVFEIVCKIEEKQDGPMNEYIHIHHDVGFMWMPTAVTHYRITGNEVSRIRGLKAASLLAGRFNLNGRFIRAWNDDVQPDCQGWAIIDCLMNLPILYWASKELDDPRFTQIAMAHADTVLKSFLRRDGTVPHIVRFNPVTGEKIENLGGQGLGPDSVWARGQSWAIYGMAISYRETGEKRYLDAAKKTAKWFFNHLPADFVPYWDFSTPDKDKYVKDSSAACCAASGMLEIAKLTNDPTEKIFFTDCAEKLLESIIRYYACFDDSTQGIVRDGTVSYHAHRYVNVPIIYGDFFFVEALEKIQGMEGIF